MTERLPEIERLIESVRTQCAIQFNFDREHVALKQRLESEFLHIPEFNKRICEELAGLSVRYPASPGSHENVGGRFPNLPIRHDAGAADFVFSLLKNQKYVLLDLSAVSRLPLIGEGLPIVAASLAAPATGSYKGLASALLRPDGHIAWMSEVPFSKYLPQAEIEQWLPSVAQTPLRMES